MSMISVSSERNTVDDVVGELIKKLGSKNMKLLVYFASTKFDPKELSAKIKLAFPDVTMFGCSTAGEIQGGKMLTGSLVAMAFDSASLTDVKVEVVENLTCRIEITKSLRSFEKHFSEPISTMKASCYLGIVLVDGMSRLEEKLMEAVGDKTNFLFVGGSAADDFKFQSTQVFANGKSYSNSAVLALLKLAVPFDIIKTQSVCIIGPELVVTKVNENKREIIEFNNKPAAVAYAEALGVSVNELAACFPGNPLGLLIDGEPYIRSPKHISGNSVFFHSGSAKGTRLSLLKSTDTIEDTKSALSRSKAKLGRVSGVIVFNCAHRALELKYKDQTEKYGELFSGIPTIGFNSYGEQYIGHMNQTAVIIVFG